MGFLRKGLRKPFIGTKTDSENVKGLPLRVAPAGNKSQEKNRRPSIASNSTLAKNYYLGRRPHMEHLGIKPIQMAPSAAPAHV